jgi:signal transduction histidine kinase
MSILAFVMFGCGEWRAVALNVVWENNCVPAYVIMGIVCLLPALLLWISFRRKIRNEREENRMIAAQAMLEGKKEERKRLARDLHDGLGGMLSAVKVALVADNADLPFLRKKINCCIEELARVAHHLMPASLSHFGLKAALQDYCLSFSNVKFHFFGEDRRFDERIEFEVYCCACELVNNSFKHSDATNIDVQLMLTDDRVMLTVYDDGCGFDKTLASKGAGLKNIKERIAVFNGKIEIHTSPGNGTETNIELKTEK